ncbi:MAG: hypothetical protein ABSA65_01480 [Acidimicrobiales bacterium]
MTRGSSVSFDREVRTGRAVGAGRRPTGPIASIVIIAGAALLLTSAAIHLNLWANGYRYKATIGPLFFAQGGVGILLSVVIALVRRVFVAVLGALFDAGTIAALLVSVHVGLFGYHTDLSAPWARTSIVIEAASAVVLLVGGALSVWVERAHIRRWRSLKTPAT